MATAAGQSGEDEGQGADRPAICTAGAPAAEMVYGVDPGTPVLEESNVLAKWATKIGSMVGGGSGDEGGGGEDILGAIAGGGGSGGTIASIRGRQQWQLPKSPPTPLLASQTRHGQGT
jgi:hypothetical protein